MTGCRYGAKSTLLKNYLYLAERVGATVAPLTTVTAVRPDGNGYRIETQPTRSWRRGHPQTYRAPQVVLAAGALGTQRLLHRMRDDGALPRLSARLGELTGTNPEAILGARTFHSDEDFARGVAIRSSFHPDEHTYVEPVRYGKGSNAMGLLGTALADGDKGPRLLAWLREVARHPAMIARDLSLRRWSEQTIIALVMQIGGAGIGDSPATGVVDPWHRAYGHEGIHVVDGSAVSANLGVNPALTICAQAERAMAFWPNNGDADPGLPSARPTSVSNRSRPSSRRCPRQRRGRSTCPSGPKEEAHDH
jgi:cholesterol oxidase